MQQTMYSVDQNSAQAFPYGYQSNQQLSLPMPNGAQNGIENHFPANPMNGAGIRRNPGVPLPLIDGFVDPMTQVHYKIQHTKKIYPSPSYNSGK